MPAITVRQVPPEVRDELAARAARSGRSLQEYLLAELVRMASLPSPEEAIAQVRRRARVAGIVVEVPGILADRDADRR